MPYCLPTITRYWMPVYLCYSSNLPALLHAYNTAIRAVCHSDFLFATGSPLIVPFSHSAILPLGANRAATTPLSQSAKPLLPIYQTPYCQYIILPFCHSYILTFYCFQVSAVSAVLLLLFIFFLSHIGIIRKIISIIFHTQTHQSKLHMQNYDVLCVTAVW